jgi:flagellar basal body rod protein FlgB
MDLPPLVQDNISEVLVKIIGFTGLRRSLLHGNIHNLHTPGYVPQDLPVLEFAEVLDGAVTEHVQNHRLLFQDTLHIRFGSNGVMHIRPVIDEYAKTLLDNDPDDYLELQIDRLLENTLNRMVAEQLIGQNVEGTGNASQMNVNEVIASGVFLDDPPSRPQSLE